MKKLFAAAIVLFLIFSFTSSCKENESNNSSNDIVILSKTELVLNEINKNCNLFTTDKGFPIITAEEVKKGLDDHNLIIDIRSAKDFADGHIKGAINLKMKELIDYAQVSGFPDFSKVILVCYTGQSASYGAATLQMLGYNNVYAMKYGMTSWNHKFTAKWEHNISDELVNELSTKDGIKETKYSLPEIISEKNSGPEILYERAKNLLKEGFPKAGADLKFLKAFAKKLYIIDYTDPETYKKGHLKKAVFFAKGTLNLDKDLLYLPNDIKIAVCSYNGQESAFIAAYLNILGYDAKTVKYGINSFMTSKAGENSFKNAAINNFPYETSVYIHVEEEVSEGGC